MKKNVQSSVIALRDNLRSRKAHAESAFQDFKLKEIVKELPALELAQADGWQAPGPTPPSPPKPRMR